MLRSLDISPIFKTPEEERMPEFYSSWRSFFYGNLEPGGFLIDSVEKELEALMPKGPEAVRSSPKKGSKGKKLAGRKAKVKVPNVEPVSFERGSVIYWVSQARDVFLASGGELTPALVQKMVSFLLEALEASVNSREKSQLAYVLRTLGYRFPKDEQDAPEVYSVIMEFDGGKGPTMIYASSDSYACAYWHQGGKKWSVFDKGEGSLLAKRLCSLGEELYGRLSDKVQDDVPPIPIKERLTFSVVTSEGVKTVSVLGSDVSSSGLDGLFNGFVTLFKILVGQEFDRRRFGVDSEVSLDLDIYPLKLEGTKLSYAPLFSRGLSFLIDLGIFSIILAGFMFFLAPIVIKWGVIPATIVLVFVAFLFPILSAWMESSPEWGHSTFGKRLMGVHVHGVNSPHIIFSQALTRNMVKYVLSPLFCMCGFVWALFQPYKRAWHDLLSDTVVLDGAVPMDRFETYNHNGRPIQLEGDDTKADLGNRGDTKDKGLEE
jgi:uncharacterized RDD family membrane protein YckC